MGDSFHEIYDGNKYIPAKILLHAGDKKNRFVIDHWHNELEIIYLHNTKCKIYTDGQMTEVKEGEVFLINSRKSHAIYREEDESYPYKKSLSITVDWDYLKQMNPEIDNLQFDIAKNTLDEEHVKNIILKIYHIYDGTLFPFYYLKVNSLLDELLYLLFTECTEKKNIVEVVKSQKYYERMSNILEYMKEHYNEDLSIELVAAEFGFSREHLSRNFKQYIGETFGSHLSMIRLEQAQKDLVDTDYPIFQIAVNHGFSNVRAYTKTFMKVYGISPGKYRKGLLRN